MLSIVDQEKNKAKSAEQRKDELVRMIELGESSERLGGNTDWIRFKRSVEQEIEYYEGQKAQLYDSLINQALTVDQKLESVDKIRALAQQINDFKFVVGLVAARITAGEAARVQLEEMEEKDA